MLIPGPAAKKMATKRIVWRENGLVSLKLRDGLFTIAQMLKSPYMRFFDVTSEDGRWRDLDLDRVKPLFTVLVGQVVLRKLVVAEVDDESVVPSKAPFETLWIRPRLAPGAGFPFRGGDLVEVDPSVGYVHAPIVKENLSPKRHRRIIERHELVNMWGEHDLRVRLLEYFETGHDRDPMKAKVFRAD